MVNGGWGGEGRITIFVESMQVVVTDKLIKFEEKKKKIKIKMSPEISVGVRLDPNIIAGLK